MNPWQVKDEIDSAMLLADRNGFSLEQVWNYSGGETICLLTKGSNEHGFANHVVLEQFRTWREAIVFLSGWEKHQLATTIEAARAKAKRGKK